MVSPTASPAVRRLDPLRVAATPRSKRMFCADWTYHGPIAVGFSREAIPMNPVSPSTSNEFDNAIIPLFQGREDCPPTTRRAASPCPCFFPTRHHSTNKRDQSRLPLAEQIHHSGLRTRLFCQSRTRLFQRSRRPAGTAGAASAVIGPLWFLMMVAMIS